MRFLIITSSYPATADDATGTAGLFVRDFARALVSFGHEVIVNAAARKTSYESEPGITVMPIPWRGGEGELASYPFSSPSAWPVLFGFLRAGSEMARSVTAERKVDRILCMWIVPSGLFGRTARRANGTPYDVWALGSDVWRISRLPFGTFILRGILRGAGYVFADGQDFSRRVSAIAGRDCMFLPSSRLLPAPGTAGVRGQSRGRTRLLFVGRYHPNKGPDLLLEAIALLPAAVRETLEFDLFGYGVLRARLEELIRVHNLSECVHLHETIDAQELSDLLTITDFLIIPSRIESIPVVLSDAAQRGVPVIVTDVGDMGMSVRRHEAGVVVPHPDPSSIRDGILHAVEAGREIFLPGIARLASEFDIREVARRWVEMGSKKE